MIMSPQAHYQADMDTGISIGAYQKMTIGMAQEGTNNHCHMHLNSHIVSMFPAGDAIWCPEPWKLDLIGIFQGCSFSIDTRSENQTLYIMETTPDLTQGVSMGTQSLSARRSRQTPYYWVGAQGMQNRERRRRNRRKPVTYKSHICHRPS